MRFRYLVAACVLASLGVPASAADERRTPRRRSSSASRWPRRGSGARRSTGGSGPSKIDPSYAAAYNNLAVAYEHEGQFEKARKAYDKAAELDPNNAMVRQNYDLFKEINDRTNRRGNTQ